MRSKLIFFVVVISLILMVFSCSDKKSTEPDTSAGIIYSDNTVVVPDDVSAGIIEVTDDQVIISTEVVSVDDYQIGDILLSGPAENAPYGFLRKIEEVVLQENQIIYQTSLATLEDAFYQLKISESRRLKTTDVIDAQPMVEGVEFLPDSRNPFDFSFNIDTSFDLDDNVSFDIDGSLVASMGYHFDVEIDWLLRLKTIKFEPFVTANSDLAVTINGGFSYEQEIVLYEIRFGVIMFGPIPTTPNVSIILSIDANGEAAVTTSIICNADASINLAYQQGDWSSSYDRNISFDSSPPSLSSNLSLSVGAGPRLDILLFDVTGPYLIPLGYLNFNANLNLTPWWELYGGYKATIGVRGRIFSINLFNYEIVDIINYSFLIAQAEISTVATPTFSPPGGIYTSPQTVTISCATSGATIRYTTNGSDPSESSPTYTNPLQISTTTTLKARGFKSGWTPSNVASAQYTIGDAPPVPGMIFVQGGTFKPFDSDGSRTDYWVTLSSYYIGKYEVTQAEYEAVMGTNPSYFGGNPNRPVEQVSWFNAIEYCNRLSVIEGFTPAYSYSSFGTNPDNWPTGWNTIDANHTNVSCNWSVNGYRLLTEMEWMFAAMGGNQSQGYTYSGSNNIDEVAWYSSNSGGRTHDIGTKAPNELMTYDMSGNVWNWVWDIYGSYPTGSYSNPTGAVDGVRRVRRGGGCLSMDYGCTYFYRGRDYDPISILSDQGFRVSRVVP